MGKYLKGKDLKHNDFSYQEKWQTFTLNDTTEATIIKHWPASAACGVLMTASQTIVLTARGDTIRIIGLCNLKDFKVGEHVKIVPGEASDYLSGLTITVNQEGVVVPSEFNLTVLRTTWGYILH